MARQNVRNASVVRDFYTYSDNSGKPDEAVEHWFAQRVEDATAVVLRSVRAGADLRSDWIGTLSAFVASSLLRTSTARSYMEQIDAHLRPLLVVHQCAQAAGVDMATLSDAGRRRLVEAARQALALMPVDEEEQRRSQLRTMLRKTDEFSAVMAEWNWEVLRAREPVLITGDAPVVVLEAEPTSGWQGLLPTNGTVAVPVAPDALLVAAPHSLLGTGAVGDELAARINARMVRNCHRAVFHHPDTPWPSGLRVPAVPPTLPTPAIAWRESASRAPTFPATYPAVADPTVDQVLERLDATDTVE